MKKNTTPSNRMIVMQVATALFLEKGYQTTSMDEIVAVSKVSKTNIYYHFKSKEELLAAIVDQMINRYTDMIDEIAAQTDWPVTDRISRFAALLTEQTPNSLGGCPFLTLYVQTSHDSEVVREAIGAFFRKQTTTMESLLQEGMDRKEIQTALPLPQLAALLVSTIEGALFLQHTQRDPALLSTILHTLATMLK
ncbi:TetR/AcrR family transcriptional regulator [Paenibacillus sp. NPDC057967]|uniref:TetR/AcrR family transcriptional regulator n=1 Tax=Paenibacillus sp. NPDC057967 TaxID=3346293 RepID=UPI0036DD38C9